jgi:hypothetical protein
LPVEWQLIAQVMQFPAQSQDPSSRHVHPSVLAGILAVIADIAAKAFAHWILQRSSCKQNLPEGYRNLQ